MIFHLSPLLVLLSITPARFVLAAPNAEANHLEARNLSPRYANVLDSHHFRRSRLLPQIPAKRSSLRKRRNCPANSSTSSEIVTTPASASSTSEDTSPIEASSDAPVASADPSSSQDAPAQGSPAPTANPPSNSDPDIQAYLNMHNNERSKHGASALSWADDLAGVAQSWANGCAFKHSQGQFGENLAAGSGTSVTPSAAVQMWIDEAPDYNPSNPQYSHWTQVVWKGTSEVGCAVTTCSSESIFGTSAYGTAEFYVCEYRPAGNVIGQFAANVQP